MKCTLSILSIILIFASHSYAQDSISKRRKTPKKKITHIYPKKKKFTYSADTVSVIPQPIDTTLCFPLTKDRLYNVYDYMIDINDSKVIARYKPYFDKYEYQYSGYVWEAMLKLMLIDADKELSDYTVIRSEKNMVMINITKYLNMKMLPEYMCKIFSDLKQFETYLKNADRKRVPSY